MRQPHAVTVAPTVNWPTDAPILPVPLMIPVTVLTAFVFLPALSLPISAAHVIEIVLSAPDMKMPRKKKQIRQVT